MKEGEDERFFVLVEGEEVASCTRLGRCPSLWLRCLGILNEESRTQTSGGGFLGTVHRKFRTRFFTRKSAVDRDVSS